MPPTSLWVLCSDFISRVTAPRLSSSSSFFLLASPDSPREREVSLGNYTAFPWTNLRNTLRKTPRRRVLRYFLYNADSTRIEPALLSSRGFHSVISLPERLGDRLKNRDVNKMRRVGSSTLFLPAPRAPQWRFTEKRSEDNGQLMVFVTQPHPPRPPPPPPKRDIGDAYQAITRWRINAISDSTFLGGPIFFSNLRPLRPPKTASQISRLTSILWPLEGR